MSGKKILIVEDESVQLTMVAKRLKNAGYSVVGAHAKNSRTSFFWILKYLRETALW